MKKSWMGRGGVVVVFCAMATWAQEPGAKTSAKVLSEARVYRYDELPVRHMANGGESRDVMRGELLTGEAVSVHESVLAAGMKPNTPHVIDHSEIMTVVEGTVSFEHDGKAERVGPGGVIYVAKGTLHTVRNVGDGPARYCVVAIGGDVKR